MFYTKLEDTMNSGDVEEFFKNATGRKYDPKNDASINDIRRFCAYFWNSELKKRLNLTSSNARNVNALISEVSNSIGSLQNEMWNNGSSK